MAILFTLHAHGPAAPQEVLATTSATVAASDTCPLGLDEASAILVTFSVTDSCAVSISDETASVAPSVGATDTVVLGSTDTASISSTLSVADSAAVGTSDLAAIVVVGVVTDTLTLPLTDTITQVSAVLTTIDIAAIQTIDAYAVYLDLAYLTAQYQFPTDSLTLGLADQWRTVVGTDVAGTGVGFTHWEVAEVFACAIIEYGQGLHNIVVIGLQDATPAVLVLVSVDDTLALGTADAASVVVAGTVTDSLSVTLDESAALLIGFFTTDSCAVQVSEATNIVQNTLLSTTDTCAVLASESTPLIGQVFQVPDTCAVLASDVNIGPHAATAQDDLPIGLAEASTSSLPTLASDILSIGAPEPQPRISIAITVTDTCAVILSEVATQQVSGASIPIAAVDSLALPLVDDIEPILVTVSVADTAPLVLDEMVAAPAIPAEQVALMLLEEVRLEITLLEHLWAGGMRKEEAHFLYPTSVRMGERNADETRAGTW